MSAHINRDSRGRFVSGNTICHSGWAGLVSKRFGGDEALARRWCGRIGAYQYSVMTVAGSPLAHKLPFAHPGSPEDFCRSQDVSFGYRGW